MAIYGEYGGPIKKTLGDLTVATSNGSNTNQEITDPAQTGNISNSSVTCIITTTGDVRVGLGEAATGTSFLLTSADTLIAKVTSGTNVGLYGDGGTPTVTIKKIVC